MSDHNFLKSVKTVSFYTFLSRILGLARDILCAGFFGTSMVWDAFTIAFRLPNLFRRLFGEGALSAAFIPVFTEYLETKDRKEAWELARNLGTILFCLLAGIVIVGEATFCIVPRLTDLQPKWDLVFDLLLIMFPYVMFICLVAFSMAILNSLKHFLVPVLAPIILNLCWIFGIVVVASIFGHTAREKIVCVSYAILFAGFAQLGIQLPALRRFGMDFRPIFNLSHPALKRIFKLMGPTIFGLAIVQINVLLDSLIAVGFAPPAEGKEAFALFGREFLYPLKTGAASSLYYGDRLIQFPLGVFGIALANVIFPLFSAHAARQEWSNFKSTLNNAIRLMLFIGVPASIGLILLRQPLVELFYERKAFDAESTMRTTSVIFFYSIAVWAYCGLHVIVRAFYSLKDTKTPMKVGVCMVALNLVLNLTLIWFFKVGGLALATSISAILQLIVLVIILKKRLDFSFDRELISSFLITCAGTLFMAAACISSHKYLSSIFDNDSLTSKLARLIAPLIASLAVYFIVSFLLKSTELKQLMRKGKNKKIAVAEPEE